MKIICIGRNYKSHVKELENELPKEPVIFHKPKSALIKPGLPMHHPKFTQKLDYECEIVLRVCKNGKRIPIRESRRFVDQWTVGIDFTARDLQEKLKEKGLPWEVAKSFDNSAAVGNFRTINFNELYNSNFSLFQNGQIVQLGDTSEMIFSFEKIISYTSQFFTLNIGDLIFTGTPSGVGQVLPYDNFEAFLNGEKLLEIEIR